MGFSRQESWSGLPCPAPPGIFLTRDGTWVSCIAGAFFTTELPGRPVCHTVGVRRLLTDTEQFTVLAVTEGMLGNWLHTSVEHHSCHDTAGLLSSLFAETPSVFWCLLLLEWHAVAHGLSFY